MIDTLTISYDIGSDIIPSPDDVVDPENVYFEYSYRLMIPEEGDSPFDEHWYEENDGEYKLTEDIEAVDGKDYYSYGLVMVEPSGNEVPSDLGWFEATEGITVSNLKSTLSFATVVEDVPIEITEDAGDEEDGIPIDG